MLVSLSPIFAFVAIFSNRRTLESVLIMVRRLGKQCRLSTASHSTAVQGTITKQREKGRDVMQCDLQIGGAMTE